MEVRGIGWLGVRTDQFTEITGFFSRVLQLRQVREEDDLAVFETADGQTVEVFGPGDRDHVHFSTGPVVGFLVDDVDKGRQELEAAGVAVLGPVQRDGGMAWVHFRGPDGNVYELTSRSSDDGA